MADIIDTNNHKQEDVKKEEEEDDETDDDEKLLYDGPWQEVHQQLINAVLISKDAVAIQKAQRRFWLTEINANLNDEGKC